MSGVLLVVADACTVRKRHNFYAYKEKNCYKAYEYHNLLVWVSWCWFTLKHATLAERKKRGRGRKWTQQDERWATKWILLSCEGEYIRQAKQCFNDRAKKQKMGTAAIWSCIARTALVHLCFAILGSWNMQKVKKGKVIDTYYITKAGDNCVSMGIT